MSVQMAPGRHSPLLLVVVFVVVPVFAFVPVLLTPMTCEQLLPGTQSFALVSHGLPGKHCVVVWAVLQLLPGAQ